VLSAESKRVELATELATANYEGNWYWKVKHLRNYSLHGSLLSPDASLDVIPYFEQTVARLKEFIKNIKIKEPFAMKITSNKKHGSSSVFQPPHVVGHMFNVSLGIGNDSLLQLLLLLSRNVRLDAIYNQILKAESIL
jgi:hypothetical protein